MLWYFYELSFLILLWNIFYIYCYGIFFSFSDTQFVPKHNAFLRSKMWSRTTEYQKEYPFFFKKNLHFKKILYFNSTGIQLICGLRWFLHFFFKFELNLTHHFVFSWFIQVKKQKKIEFVLIFFKMGPTFLFKVRLGARLLYIFIKSHAILRTLMWNSDRGFSHVFKFI